MINKERLIKLTQDLLRINSENPPGNEQAVVRFIASYLKKIGMNPKVYEFFPRRSNVLAVYKGRRRSGALLLTPHVDTVPAGSGWHVPPFSGAVRGGRLYGRGATDCKGNCAVAMEVLTSLAEEGFTPGSDIIFLATADEETGSSRGLIPFLKKNILHPAAALILDSDEFSIITAQKGLIHCKVSVKGRKAHGAYPDRGVNAIDQAYVLMDVIKKIKFSYTPHRLLKPPTVNIGTVRGGDKVNMVADWCVFEVDLRFLPGMEARTLLAQIKKAFDKTDISYHLEINDIQNPYEIGAKHPLVDSLKKASRGIVKRSAIKGSEGATVITFFKKKGIPAVATGYGVSGCANTTDEYITVDNLFRGARVLERFVKIFDKKLV